MGSTRYRYQRRAPVATEEVRPRLLLFAAGLDWLGTSWGLLLADGVPIAVWPLAAAFPFGFAVAAIRWRRWFGWVLFASATVGAVWQLGSWGWRVGVALVEAASAVSVLRGMSRMSRSKASSA